MQPSRVRPGSRLLAYHVVHLLGSLALGVLAAVLLHETELHRSLWYFGFMILLATGVYAVTFFGVVGVEIGGAARWSTVLVGTAAWAGPMTAWLLWTHRRLVARIRQDLEDVR